MSSDVLIRAEGVSKKFSSKLKTSMKYGIIDIARDFMGAPTHSDKLRQNEFWSVQDVSFEVRRGECLGLIGPNGAGKSTLLKMLNGIIMPDKGSIEINGRVGALIEVGAGFHPLLSGRENIYINGSIMGLRKKEIDQKFDSIVEFAELGDFIDMPVSYYSSGMYVRLGFAIAAHLEPDVLLIDEVIAVGDVGFKAKCFNAIANITKKCAVIFVSHNMANITKISTDILLLREGHKEYQGRDISEGIYKYLDQFPIQKMVPIGQDKVLLKSCRVRGEECSNGVVKYLGNIFIDIEFIFLQECWTDALILVFIDKEANHAAVTYLKIPEEFFRINSLNNLTVKIPQNPFSTGNYLVTVIFAETFNDTINGRVISQYNSAVSFKVIDSKAVTNIPIQLESELVIGKY